MNSDSIELLQLFASEKIKYLIVGADMRSLPSFHLTTPS